MNRLVAAAAAVQQVCHERDWGYCFVGGLAVRRWGRPRPTKDVDLIVLAGYGAETAVADALFARFAARFDNSRQFARDCRVVQIWAADRVAVDAVLGTSRRLGRIVRRASPWQVDGVALRTFSAEDLVVHKALSGRERDWLDVAGIVARQGDRLDRALILREFAPMLAQQGPHLGDPLAGLQRQQGHEALDRLASMLDVPPAPG
ncbi:hypothetical protein GCM10011608_01580 [Micromonospora sonchi]|uniref:Nucleotidyltransferase family protein n=1 Tax=Micromonospora sonchi TaxID=1763543 RepID=A0A917TEJ4_9ACTN|nr:nucleotidyltransferase [Micromonospora sonchi]GGM20661.1 hypothetical protein GCM10011608_01580 [Micromonospora sonchi]